jgi:hypothetical protein
VDFFRTLLAIVVCVTTLTACVSSRYQMASKNVPPPASLNIAATQPPVELALKSVIAYKGPGSWKEEALWDEYVVEIHNQGEQPLTIVAATLVDFAGDRHVAGTDPWDLEKESLTLEKQYRHRGVDFARAAAPGVLIVGAGYATIASAGIFSAAAGGAAVATVIALPVYYGIVIGVNHYNKKDVMEEFTRRRVALPLTLGSGESRIGSLFFPMTPNPQSLDLQWSIGPANGVAVIPLQALHGLHAKNK